MSYERIQRALDSVLQHEGGLTIYQGAFNLLQTVPTPLQDQWPDLKTALDKIEEELETWADRVLGPEENGNGKGQWADDGGGNLE